MPKRITVAKTTDIPNNEARAYPVGDRMIAIFNQDGEYHAMDDFCPHMGASLAGGWIEGGTVACPWHAWRFSLSDGCWLDNPKIKVDIFSVEVVGDEIQVEFPDE
jgi:nitrite reductase (NADH) small subunit/3-phenylpropionate/trans-cinnamate dioxygenase ferredoxin subunit